MRTYFYYNPDMSWVEGTCTEAQKLIMEKEPAFKGVVYQEVVHSGDSIKIPVPEALMNQETEPKPEEESTKKNKR